MDLVMPGMDGDEATRLLRRTCTKDVLPIIGITASIFEKEKQQFLGAGINAFITKPFREQELYEVLEHYAGVLFQTEEPRGSEDAPRTTKTPSLVKMSAEWCEAFCSALNRSSITRIRKLADEAREIDPLLSSWILTRAEMYDLGGLKKLSDD